MVCKMVTWQCLFSILIERYLNDVVLGEAYAGVTTAHQRDAETEDEFGTRLINCAGLCSGVFNKPILIIFSVEDCYLQPPRL